MTTPADNSAYAIINDAYLDAGLKQRIDPLNGEQLAEGMRRLREVITTAQMSGLKVFSWVDTTVPLTAAQMDYTLMPSGSVNMTKPLRVLQAFYLYNDTNVRRNLTVLAMKDYYELGAAGEEESNQGTISQCYVEKLYDRLRVTFWLCPNAAEAAAGAVHLILQGQITQPTELDETVQFPPEWRSYLHWNLSAEICTGQPQAVIERCEGKARFYRELSENWDVEDAPVQFQADSRMGVEGNFR